MTHVTCRLTAKNRDQLRNPRNGYVGPTFSSSFGPAIYSPAVFTLSFLTVLYFSFCISVHLRTPLTVRNLWSLGPILSIHAEINTIRTSLGPRLVPLFLLFLRYEQELVWLWQQQNYCIRIGVTMFRITVLSSDKFWFCASLQSLYRSHHPTK